MLSRLSALSLKVDFDMSNTSYYDYLFLMMIGIGMLLFDQLATHPFPHPL